MKFYQPTDDEGFSPKDDCRCSVCKWAYNRIERERRLDADLDQNYGRYLAGELVSREERE